MYIYINDDINKDDVKTLSKNHCIIIGYYSDL